MRPLKNFLLCLATALISGCASYHFGAVNGAVAGEKSVEVLPFNNQTLQPRLGDALTQALRERLQVDGTYHLATHGPGDVIVTGVIHQYARETLGFASTDVATPVDYQVGATVHVTVRDRLSGKLLLDKDVKGHTLVNIGSDLGSAERQALPLLAQDVAQNIAELLTEGAW
jgi:hypothetical protein